jgi:YidC/Oxa1 family membrane protein insertase
LESITQIWNELVVSKLEWVLMTLADLPGVGGGLAIILMTLLVKTVLLPLSIKQTASMKSMWSLQPEIAAIKQRYKDDRQKISQETMQLYKERGINPMAGCLPMLPTIVVFAALYGALWNLAQSNAAGECVGSCRPEFQESFLWVTRLDHPDVVNLFGFPLPGILPIVMAISQFFSSKMMVLPTADPQQAMMNRMTTVIMPAMMLFWGVTFPAGLVLYWFISNVYEMVRLYFTMGPETLKMDLNPKSFINGFKTMFAAPAESDASSKNGRAANNGTTRGDLSGGDARASRRPGRTRNKRGRRSGRR